MCARRTRRRRGPRVGIDRPPPQASATLGRGHGLGPCIVLGAQRHPSRRGRCCAARWGSFRRCNRWHRRYPLLSSIYPRGWCSAERQRGSCLQPERQRRCRLATVPPLWWCAKLGAVIWPAARPAAIACATERPCASSRGGAKLDVAHATPGDRWSRRCRLGHRTGGTSLTSRLSWQGAGGWCQTCRRRGALLASGPPTLAAAGLVAANGRPAPPARPYIQAQRFRDHAKRQGVCARRCKLRVGRA